MASKGVEPFFLDTNILVAATDASRNGHADCAELLRQGFEGRAALCCSNQVHREYLVVATRPVAVNGLGMTTSQATRNVERFQQAAAVLDDTVSSGKRLLGLVRKHRLVGKRIHDANLVAVSLERGIHRLVTLNPSDFAGFGDLLVLSPAEALGEPGPRGPAPDSPTDTPRKP